MPKLERLISEDGIIPRDVYGNVFFHQHCGDSERLVIGPSSSHIKILDLLSATFPEEKYYLLYVLILSHAGYEPGRYESPAIHNHEDVRLFIWTFQEFFEHDGRHHLWIASEVSNNVLIYDQHDLIFAYGDLEHFESILIDNDYKREEFWIPAPHAHIFNPANAKSEDELMSYFEWKHFDLQPGDDWDE
ncbi:MAG: hypothetical protein AAGB26_10770 [Planctomycetota bacterium]